MWYTPSYQSQQVGRQKQKYNYVQKLQQFEVSLSSNENSPTGTTLIQQALNEST